MASPIRLGADGFFRTTDGQTFIPLGGFHGNVMPTPMLRLSDAEMARVKPLLWSRNNLDLYDASDETLEVWFKGLEDNGVTAIRLFPRARVSHDVLDLCGKLNPRLSAAFSRAFAAAARHNIRILLQIMPEPDRTCYLNPRDIDPVVLPAFTKEDLDKLTPAQKRFLVDRKPATLNNYFSDPDVLACQKLYLQSALEWLAKEPQVFAIEIYNEQGWQTGDVDGQSGKVYTYPFEAQEIEWTRQLVDVIKKRLPDMPVCLSHPGFGISGMDPLLWTKGAGTTFYEAHLYAGLCGENDKADFAAITAASGVLIQSLTPNLTGEWGVLNRRVPADLRRRAHRDAIWLSVLSGQPGFMQWTYDYPEEYRWPNKVLSSLPKGFSPQPAAVAVDVGDAYRAFQNNSRYPLFKPDVFFPAFAHNKQKQADENLKRLFAAYMRALELGVPVRYVMAPDGAMPLDQFLSADPSRFAHPLQAVGGFQLSYLKDRNSATWVAYLRSRTIQNAEGFFLGAPKSNPLSLKLALPPGNYAVRIVNIQTNEDRTTNAAADGTVNIADNTSDEFAIVISGK